MTPEIYKEIASYIPCQISPKKCYDIITECNFVWRSGGVIVYGKVATFIRMSYKVVLNVMGMNYVCYNYEHIPIC